MVKRFVIIFFLITTSVSANSDCKYYAEADVVDDKLINKVHKILNRPHNLKLLEVA